MTIRTAIAVIVALVASFVNGLHAHAASYEHIDSLALRLQNHAATLYQEFHLHYEHTAEFPHLISDAQNLYFQAARIHELAHCHGSLIYLANELRVLDHSFHHLDKLVHQVELGADFGHIGHVHVPTSHVRRVLKRMQRDIHHLRDDVQKLTRHHHRRPSSRHRIAPQYRRIENTSGRGPRNYGEIRSNWKYGLNDLHRGPKRFSQGFR